MRNEVRQQTFPEIKRELMKRHLYADIDIVVKFRSQTLLHILGMISLYVKMKMERDRYWESLEKKQKHTSHIIAFILLPN